MRLKAAGAVLALGMAGTVLVGCTGGPLADSGVGTLQRGNREATIVVPALWAGKAADGQPVGGIEPAEIVVSTAGETSEYGVDLADAAARGAGPAWLAATGMAASFSTIFVGADPRTVDYHFSVTGPIDGPSAGGLLTVGIIAAFRGDSLERGVTMTGTISADGSIGPVGGVPTKINAAADEGFTTIVVPASLQPNGWGADSPLMGTARERGVTLVPVHTIGEAYAAMTGRAYTPLPAPSSLTWPAPVEAAARATTTSAIAALQQAIETAGSALDPDARRVATETLATSESALRAGNLETAYGTAAFGLTQVARASGASQVEQDLEQGGEVVAADRLRQRAERTLADARARLDASSRQPVRGLEQGAALATALGWATFSEATMEGLLAELARTPTPVTLVEMGRTVAEAQVDIGVFLDDSVEIVDVVSSSVLMPDAEVARHLGDYSAFLLRAAESGETYLRDVLGTEGSADGSYALGGYAAAAIAARDRSRETPTAPEALADQARRFSTALTYYWLTSYAVAAQQAYAVVAGPGGSPAAGRQDAMDAAVDETWGFVADRAAALEKSGLAVSGVTWPSAWAMSQAQAVRATPLATQSDWLAQGELWYDAVQVMLLASTVAPAVLPAGDGG